MPVIVNKSEALNRLETMINNGIKVLLVDYPDAEIVVLLLTALKNRNLTMVQIWNYVEEVPKDKQLIYIPQKDMNEVLEMYRMYEFSDKVTVISDTSQYGSLFNYIKTGILTKEEMVDALLYKL